MAHLKNSFQSQAKLSGADLSMEASTLCLARSFCSSACHFLLVSPKFTPFSELQATQRFGLQQRPRPALCQGSALVSHQRLKQLSRSHRRANERHRLCHPCAIATKVTRAPGLARSHGIWSLDSRGIGAFLFPVPTGFKKLPCFNLNKAPPTSPEPSQATS